MTLRVLLAEDDAVLRTVAGGVLRAEGFEVEEAEDGLAALEAFRRNRPDLVLTDFSMPRMDGLALTRAVREESGSSHVPVIVFTGGGRPGLLQESLAAGAVEYLTKPFTPDELRCRVKAIAEIVALNHSLAEAKARDDEELALTKHVLNRLLEPGHHSLPPGLAMETITTHRINGDACSYRSGLPDVHYGLVCDATGHGLTAGVSTIPVLEAFATMASRDAPLESIYLEMNRKLSMMMPTGRFVCMALVRLDAGNGQLSVLNAGMPPVGLVRPDLEGIRTIPSRNLPAGVMANPGDVVVEDLEVMPGDRLLVCSDGVVDLFDEMHFLTELLLQWGDLPHLEQVGLIRSRIMAHLGDADLHDDITFALWDMRPPTLRPSQLKAQQEAIPDDLIPGLKLCMELNPRMQQVRDILPHVNALLSYEHIAPADARILALLLAEVLTNSLDHGVLGLSSALKDEGFEVYDEERRQRLARLEGGYLRLHLSLAHDPLDSRVRLMEVEIQDSGPGFDWRKALEKPPDFTSPSGRGLTLLRALSRDLSFNEAGNQVRFRLACG